MNSSKAFICGKVKPALLHSQKLWATKLLARCLLLLFSVAAAQAQQSHFHTPPSCWDSPRLYHAGKLDVGSADQIEVGLLQPSIGIELATKTSPDLIAPNRAYRLWNQVIYEADASPWRHRVVVDVEGGRWHTLSFADVASPVMPVWISEKLLYMRVMWGRVTFEDVIWDVEQNGIIYRETVLDGYSAYTQFKQSCQENCACATSSPAQEWPQSRPAEDQAIGLVLLPTVYGAGETGGVRASESGQAVDVYREANANSQVVARPQKPVHFESEAYSYEAGAAVVFGRRDGWLRVKLRGQPVDSGWIQEDSERTFLSLAELLPKRLAYLNSAWDGVEYSSLTPTGYAQKSPFFDPERSSEEIPVEIYEVRETASGYWVQLAFHLSHPCESGAGGLSEKVWVPAFNRSGQKTIWFWSRGC